MRSAERGGLETLTFAELDHRSAELHDRIAAQVLPGDFVMLSDRNSIAWIVALFAISQAGAVPVPLDAEMSEDLLALYSERTRPRTIEADGEFLERTEGVGRVRITLDAPADDAPTATSDADPRRRAQAGLARRGDLHRGHDRAAEGRDAEPP